MNGPTTQVSETVGTAIVIVICLHFWSSSSECQKFFEGFICTSVTGYVQFSGSEAISQGNQLASVHGNLN